MKDLSVCLCVYCVWGYCLCLVVRVYVCVCACVRAFLFVCKVQILFFMCVLDCRISHIGVQGV
jgi:hypothetical protein